MTTTRSMRDEPGAETMSTPLAAVYGDALAMIGSREAVPALVER